MDKKQLWLNLAAYHFDHLVPTHLWDVIAAKFGGQNPFTKAFADKLSRKLDWNCDFALKAIWEYKKFVYLGVISDFSVTPSKIIDQVWHEHLLFSAGYRKFCEEVIEHNFDHNPELVSVSSQTDTFHNQYFETLELYEAEFGSAAPENIWNATKFTGNREQMKKHFKRDHGSSLDSGSETLISLFPSADSSSFEFNGGEFGGAGASSSWDTADCNDSNSSVDSGGSSDSGSSCSSGCGGD